MTLLALSDEQRAVATSPEEHLLLLAPPGCGKTEVLARRAAHLIDSLSPHQQILALTFTKRARANLEDRLRVVVGDSRARRHILVRNLHGFAAQIVMSHGRTIGLDVPALILPKTSTMRKAMEEAGGGFAMFAAESILRDIKRQPLTDQEVLDVLAKQPETFASHLAQQVEQTRQGNNQLHYDDLLRHAQVLLRIPAVARVYQAHFGAVLIDEFQDLSLQQLDLALLSSSSSRTFAGDPLQGIYSWAGAAPTEVEAEILRVTGTPERLRQSYRSSPKVLGVVNSLSEQIDPDSVLESAIPDAWHDGGFSAALTFNDGAEEAQYLIDAVERIMTARPDATIGVISRAAWRRSDLDSAFAGVKAYPVRRWDLAIDDPSVVALIQAAVASLPRGATLAEARTAVFSSVDATDVDTRELLDDAFDVLARSDATTARGAVQAIRVADPQRTIGPGVHLLNAHTGKGQQFDWVFVIGLEEDHVPAKKSNTGPALAEEQRVLLVMLSRARHGLILTRIERVASWNGTKSARPSRWWSSIRTDTTAPNRLLGHINSFAPRTAE